MVLICFYFGLRDAVPGTREKNEEVVLRPHSVEYCMLDSACPNSLIAEVLINCWHFPLAVADIDPFVEYLGSVDLESLKALASILVEECETDDAEHFQIARKSCLKSSRHTKLGLVLVFDVDWPRSFELTNLSGCSCFCAG